MPIYGECAQTVEFSGPHLKKIKNRKNKIQMLFYTSPENFIGKYCKMQKP